MSKRDLLAVALKFAGVLMMASAAISAPSTGSWAYYLLHDSGRESPPLSNPPLYLLMTLLATAATVCIGAWLAFRGDSVADRLESDTAQVSFDRSFWSAPAFGIAIRVVGVVLLAYAVPSLIGVFGGRYLQMRPLVAGSAMDAFSGDFWRQHSDAVMEQSAIILVGAVLLFAANGITRLVFREGGESDGSAS